MATNSVRLAFDTGPLRERIARASQELQQQVAELLVAWAEVAASGAKAAAPRGKTGNLANGNRVTEISRHRVLVRNHARHAHFEEFGTISRYWRSTGKATGKITARPYFYPAVSAARRRMWHQFEALLAREETLV